MDKAKELKLKNQEVIVDAKEIKIDIINQYHQRRKDLSVYVAENTYHM